MVANVNSQPASLLKFLLGRFVMILQGVTVEPIIFCNYLAFAFFRVAEHAGVYRVICIQNYAHLPNVNCYRLKDRPDIEDKVKSLKFKVRCKLLWKT